MHNLYVRLAPSLLAIIELFLMAGAIGLIFLPRRTHPASGLLSFQRIEHAFACLASNRRLAVFSVGTGVVVLRVALLPILGIPQPRWNDEFSYLLSADTFAHGKLTNATHPMWIHFESFHIIEHPTYMSMYPPAQGLMLAAGQVLGHPWIGQLLVTAAMCSALCWMLQAWLPARWALFGAILAALRVGLLSYWMNTYWCASLAALGGALVLGAWPRLRRRASVGAPLVISSSIISSSSVSSRTISSLVTSSLVINSMIMAVGLVILANSRPYEGFVFSAPIAAAIFLWLSGRGRHAAAFRVMLPRVVFPIVITLTFAGAITGYYYYRVTGIPWRMAYQVNRETYAMAPYFVWQAPRPEPVYHHEVMRRVYEWELAEFEKYRTFAGYLGGVGWKLKSWWQFYLGPLLTWPLVALPWVVRQRKMLLPLLICAAMAAAFAVQTWTLPHYFSPAICVLYLLLVQCLRHIWHWHPAGRPLGLPLGRQLVRAIPVVACAMILLRVTAASAHVSIEPAWPRGNLERAAILRQLQRLPESHLVIVRYGPHHDLDREWVYNEADIDAAKVVWARDMGRSGNQELLDYFRNRQAWVVDGDSPTPQLQPYSD